MTEAAHAAGCAWPSEDGWLHWESMGVQLDHGSPNGERSSNMYKLM